MPGVKLRISPTAEGECTYSTCREPAVGELRTHLAGRDVHPMCSQHIKPEAHSPDLRGKLYRWTASRKGA